MYASQVQKKKKIRNFGQNVSKGEECRERDEEWIAEGQESWRERDGQEPTSEKKRVTAGKVGFSPYVTMQHCHALLCTVISSR